MLTQKQEDFCLAYIETRNASEAYRRAYAAEKMKPETIAKRASELLGRREITGRLQELRAPAVAKAGITLEQHLADLQRLRDLAEADGKYSAAVSAELARGKASGLHVERVQHEGGIQIQVVTGISR